MRALVFKSGVANCVLLAEPFRRPTDLSVWSVAAVDGDARPGPAKHLTESPAQLTPRPTFAGS